MFQELSKKFAHPCGLLILLAVPHIALAGAPVEPVLHTQQRDIKQLERHLHMLNEAYPCEWEKAYTRDGHNMFDFGNGIQVLEFACTVGMHNLANLYVRVEKTSKATARLLSLHRPKGQPFTSAKVLFNSFWDLNRIALSSFTVDRGLSDCGSYEVHRFTAEGYLELIEYRAKHTCDGKFREPTDYPLIYSAL
ncbi:DUF1176 domain-containing protein [Pseudovibrio sp. Tun.PSC04-5.I4]|uniref:DUF1176 domain-containing protein n=1 Tax=Pseudovibrio sp. Tun.PSC04-5.I4 TaxID=1798213 RepID=UPI00088A9919|nr:DUF1176 domain-containing protein [Pseudovibrio sp. Tun.PSC04-5.I4]SDR34113.1 Protein of unknown function [Pseudovibrio sp. Tun.PSC04-5.I4]